MTLDNIQFGDNKWCGPSVIAALTGKTTDEAAAMIARLRGCNPSTIARVQSTEILDVLDRNGIRTHYVKPLGSLYMTLSWLSTRGDNTYIVIVPGHVVLIEVNDKKVYFLDNHTKKVMNAASSARLMQRATHVWKVSGINGKQEAKETQET